MVKILLMTAMHQRPAISELFCISARRFVEAWKLVYDIKVVSLVSDQDSEAVCLRYGIDMIHTPVQPLGMKMNVGLCNILEKYSFDYLLQISDDDIFSPDILEYYTPLIKERVPYFGVKELYFLDMPTNRALKFRYVYQTSKLVGCGRMFLREALMSTAMKCTVLGLKYKISNAVEIQKGKVMVLPLYQATYLDAMNIVTITSGATVQLWRNQQMRGLDGESELNMVMNNYFPSVVETGKPLFTDVKSDVNIWKFEDFEKFGEAVEHAESMHFWSDEERAYYTQLRKK
jgi:hypothetical protein